MDMKGEYRIEAPRQAVWDALNDPEILKRAIPGCEEIVKTSDTEMTAKVTAKVGPVKAKFQGNVTLSDMNPPESYTISGEGKGGAAGFAKGGAKVALAEDGGATVLSYEVHANVGGKLAQIGSRLIDGTAKKMADDFFGSFAGLVGGPAPSEAVAIPEPAPGAAPIGPAPVEADAAPAGPTTPPPKAPQPPPPEPGPAGLNPITWISGLIVLVLILLLFYNLV